MTGEFKSKTGTKTGTGLLCLFIAARRVRVKSTAEFKGALWSFLGQMRKSEAKWEGLGVLRKQRYLHVCRTRGGVEEWRRGFCGGGRGPLGGWSAGV